MSRAGVALILLCSFVALSHASSWATLRSCVPMAIPIFRAGSPQYQALKAISFVNNRFDPIAISKPRHKMDVSKLVNCARDADVSVCPRSGGHSFIGAGLCPGLVIDLQDLRSVRVTDSNIAEIECGANMGEVLWQVHRKNRWIAAGICPTVGVGGYMFGGGISPYMDKLGLTCDALLSVQLVDRKGRFIEASRGKRSRLFWALCGAGGSQFGIAVSLKMRTVPSQRYDNAVIFRFRWPHPRIGELMSKWDHDDKLGDRVWFRMEMNLASSEEGMNGYGACFDVDSTADCLTLLKKAPFFRTPGRVTSLISKVPSALHLHSFFGPEGGWARRPVDDARRALIEQRGTSNGAGVERVYQSAFLKIRKDGHTMNKNFWQGYADFCANPMRSSIPWLVCEIGLLRRAVRKPKYNAFAYRQSDILAHFIIGGGSAEDKKFLYRRMRNYLKRFTTGVYVNYPELELKSEYPKLYWGPKLSALKQLKRHYDPGLFFFNPQPIPV